MGEGAGGDHIWTIYGVILDLGASVGTCHRNVGHHGCLTTACSWVLIIRGRVMLCPSDVNQRLRPADIASIWGSDMNYAGTGW